MPSNASDEAVGAGLENYQHPVRHRDLANKNRAVQAVPPAQARGASTWRAIRWVDATALGCDKALRG
jgi:hypothetical protein